MKPGERKSSAYEELEAVEASYFNEVDSSDEEKTTSKKNKKFV